MTLLLVIGFGAFVVAGLFMFALCRVAARSEDDARRQWESRDHDAD